MHSSEILIRLHQTMESYACVQQGDVKDVCKGKQNTLGDVKNLCKGNTKRTTTLINRGALIKQHSY
jgi:hypothetical protein